MFMLSLPHTVSEPPARFDLVIRGGSVIDGTGSPARPADVGIRGGSIAAVGPGLGRGRREIDASGLTVAPGFIDVHTHAENVLVLPSAANFVRDGVTTVIAGNCGESPDDIGAFLAEAERRRISLNIGMLVGHSSVREKAMGGSFDRPPTFEEMQTMRGMVEAAMRQGALGLSTGLIYLPGVFAKTDEIIDLARVAARFGGIYTSHMRSEGNNIRAALEETLAVGRGASIPVQVSHVKLSGDNNWGRHAEVLGVLDAARAEGLRVTQDQYAYTASSTGLGQLIPAWALEGGSVAFRKRLADPAERARMAAEMAETPARRRRPDFNWVTLADCRCNRKLNGLGLPEATRRVKGQADVASQIDLILEIEARGGAGAVFHGMCEEDLQAVMRDPHTMVGSDSGVRRAGKSVPHPRGYGNNARVLARYVREKGVLTLEEAIRKMTSLPAETFGIADRGRLAAGLAADVVVFDPESVADTATFVAPHSFPAGIPWVVVNGEVVVRNGKQTGARPGRAIRGRQCDAAETRPGGGAYEP
jgi:N-acyl-D-amino-acid deacylase